MYTELTFFHTTPLTSISNPWHCVTFNWPQTLLASCELASCTLASTPLQLTDCKTNYLCQFIISTLYVASSHNCFMNKYPYPLPLILTNDSSCADWQWSINSFMVLNLMVPDHWVSYSTLVQMTVFWLSSWNPCVLLNKDNAPIMVQVLA